MSAYFKDQTPAVLPIPDSLKSKTEAAPVAPTPAQAAIIAAPAFQEPDVLSRREREVANLVAKGLSNKEVANQLFVTEKTVKFHLTNIFKALGYKSRAQLIVAEMQKAALRKAEAEF
jgi:DNA-binding NarL/FixJ family response regulator